ncbi:hypothetical protein BS50DRAFT_182480 [Corynespora cassiicola Philippines]|uniref:Uncharacterized protein n=1 Tax=Corynespora cassiicola Philippines TaxID=1448308 RepID=A0A2T2P6B9_CORCC|nr:hypothetical protein BS50DRAFT_182480 [Corynespora cassiicola Philippines]
MRRGTMHPRGSMYASPFLPRLLLRFPLRGCTAQLHGKSRAKKGQDCRRHRKKKPDPTTRNFVSAMGVLSTRIPNVQHPPRHIHIYEGISIRSWESCRQRTSRTFSEDSFTHHHSMSSFSTPMVGTAVGEGKDI